MNGPAEDQLLQACLKAPKHGLNAKALILQAALAGGDDSGDDTRGSEGTRAPKRQRIDPAAEAATAAARRGGEYLAAVPAQQRPLVPYLARSKIPRIHRQTVLSKLAGQHLALAAHRQQPPLEPAAAAADAPLRHGAWEAALAQELDLFGRCSSAVVYRNLAARTNATQWQPEQQPGQQQAAHPPAAQPEAPTPQQGQEAEAQAAEQRKEAQQPQQAEQPASDEHPPGQQGAAAAVGQKQAQASRQLQLEEVDIEWEAALPDSLAEQSAGPAAAAGSSRGSQAPAAAGAAPSTSRTELGTGKFTPLSAGHPSGTAPKLGGAAEPGGKAATADAEPAAAPEAGGQPAQSTPQGTAVQAEAGLSETGVGAAPGSVRQQVELFIRAELHPLLRRRHISQELHDAVAARSAAKVMQRHGGAATADFLVSEAMAIRSLVQQYLKHLQQQEQQQQKQQ